MLGSLHRYRGMALLPLAALAVHQLRYALAFGADAPQRLADQGHAYLGSLEAVAVVLCAVAAGGFLTRLAAAWCGDGETRAPERLGLLRLWLASALALIAIYTGQELLEGVLAAGHPPGVEGVLGHGGWLALPLSLAIGGGLALLLRGAQAVLELVRAAVARRRPRFAPAPLVRRRPAVVAPRRRNELADAAAGRAPPRRALALA